MSKPSNREVATLFDAAAESYDGCSNRYTTRRRAELLASQVAGRSLEIGGGTAAVTACLDDRSNAVHSDISPGMCKVASAKVGCPSVCFDAEMIPLAGDTVDTAVGCEMIYYLDHPERFVEEAHRVLRPGGRLLISATNPNVAILDRVRAGLRRLGFSRMFFDDGAPSFLSLDRIVRLLEGAGFTIERTRHIVVLPFAFLDRVNRILERTVLRHLGLFMVITARKPQERGAGRRPAK
jgi:SAM-dependent methyltransferase